MEPKFMSQNLLENTVDGSQPTANNDNDHIEVTFSNPKKENYEFETKKVKKLKLKKVIKK